MGHLSPETSAVLLLMGGLFFLAVLALVVLWSVRGTQRDFLDGDRRQLPEPSVARLDDYRRAYKQPLSDQHREPYEQICDECGAPFRFVPSHHDRLSAVGPLFRCQNGHAWRETQGIIFLDFTREPSSDELRPAGEIDTRPHGTPA